MKRVGLARAVSAAMALVGLGLAGCTAEAAPPFTPPPTATPKPSASPWPIQWPPEGFALPSPSSPTVKPAGPRLTAHLEGMRCSRAWVVGRDAVVVGVRRNGVVYVQDKKVRVRYMTGQVVTLDRPWQATHPKSTIDVIEDPSARIGVVDTDGTGVVVQRSWDNPKRVGVWRCT